MKWISSGILCLVVFFSTSNMNAFCEEAGMISGDNKKEKAVILSFDKLGRGLFNVAVSPFEIPKHSMKRAMSTDSGYGYISGLFIGVGYAVTRGFVGIYEVLSFPFPYPSHYKPIMKPIYNWE